MKGIFILLVLLVLVPCACCQESVNEIQVTEGWTVERIDVEIDFPVALALANETMFISELDLGEIRAIRDDNLTTVIRFDDVSTGGEQGLLGITLHPDYPNEPFIYAYYTRSAGLVGNMNRLVKVRVNQSTLQAEEVVVLLDDIPAGRIHNGGIVEFGSDGMIYVTTGETGEREIAQDPMSLGGKILRLNQDGSIPEDNPFPESPVYTIGHRNVFGLTFHPENGTPFITENGPNRDDEINALISGGNYGWPLVTGPSEDFLDPVRTYEEVIAPTEAAFIDGGPYPTEFQGHLLMGDFLGGRLHLIEVQENPGEDVGWSVVNESIIVDSPGGILDVERAPDGSIYVTTDGGIYLLGHI